MLLFVVIFIILGCWCVGTEGKGGSIGLQNTTKIIWVDNSKTTAGNEREHHTNTYNKHENKCTLK